MRFFCVNIMRRYGRRIRSKKSSGWSKWGGYAKKALKVANFVKGLVNAEYKMLDTSAATTPTATGYVAALSTILEGADYNNRNGLSIKAASLFLKATIFQNPAANASAVRCLICIDSDNTGTAPVVSDILETSSVISPLNHTNGKRFKILTDRTYCVNNNGEQERFIKKYIKLRHHIKYSNTTTGTRSGQLYMLVISDTLTNNPSFNYYTRLRYLDN